MTTLVQVQAEISRLGFEMVDDMGLRVPATIHIDNRFIQVVFGDDVSVTFALNRGNLRMVIRRYQDSAYGDATAETSTIAKFAQRGDHGTANT